MVCFPNWKFQAELKMRIFLEKYSKHLEYRQFVISTLNQNVLNSNGLFFHMSRVDLSEEFETG